MTQAIELRKRPHVIIATPGRLCDMIRSNMGEWSLGKVKFLVSRSESFAGSVIDAKMMYRFWMKLIDC